MVCEANTSYSQQSHRVTYRRHRRHGVTVAVTSQSSTAHRSYSAQPTCIFQCKWTLASNLTLILPALSHHHSDHTDQNIHWDVCSKEFLNLNTGKLVSPFGDLCAIGHCVGAHADCWSALWLAATALGIEDSPMLSAPVASSRVPAKQGDSPMLSTPVASSRVPVSQAKGTVLCFPNLHPAMSQPCNVTLTATALNIGTVPCFPHLTALDVWTTLCFPHHVPAKHCYVGCNSTPYRNSPMPSTPVASRHVPAKHLAATALHIGIVLCFPHLLLPTMSQPSSVILAATALHTGTVLRLPHLSLPAMSQPSSVILAATALHIGTALRFPHLSLPAMSQPSSVILAATALHIGTALRFPHLSLPAMSQPSHVT